jgi:uncharacterized protein GlcG (DUF336 family)
MRRLAMLGAAVAALAAAPTMAEPLATHRVPASLALEAVGEAVAACSKQGYAVSATVIDADAVTVAALRGDGAPVHTIEAAWQKAYTAASFAPIFKLDSGSGVAALLQRIGKNAPPGPPPFQGPEHMILRAGGLTLKVGDEVIGAIGVGGAPGAELDEACARAGLDKIGDRLR